MEGDYIVLLTQDPVNRTYSRALAAPVVPQLYHDLKMVSHVWFAVFLSVYARRPGAACARARTHVHPPGRYPHVSQGAAFPRDALVAYRAAVVAANATLAERFTDAAVLARQLSLVRLALEVRLS